MLLISKKLAFSTDYLDFSYPDIMKLLKFTHNQISVSSSSNTVCNTYTAIYVDSYVHFQILLNLFLENNYIFY